MKAALILFAVVPLGALAAYYLHLKSQKTIQALLTFSGAYLLSLGVFHLLPEVYGEHNHSVGLWIMLGFFIQLILEFFSKGIEHGHAHLGEAKKGGLPFGIIIALFLHAFLESIPIGAHSNEESKNALLWGIAVHKLPVSIIFASLLFQSSVSKFSKFFWIFAFAALAPLGTALGENVHGLVHYGNEITAMVFGIFLHISTTILFESSASHRFDFPKLAITLVGAALAWLSHGH